jgi:DNA-binding SARP family transcriptional activator
MSPEPEDARIVQRVPVSSAPPPARAGPGGSADRVSLTQPAEGIASQPPEQIGLSVIRSKVQPPPVRDSTLERPRLLDWLTGHTGDRVKVIAAEAGYGKTTLLADFARRTDVRCLWFRMETSDRDWVSFVNYLIAAVREIEPAFGNATAGMLAQIAALNPTVEIAVGSLITELEAAITAPTMLILDDFHLVEDGKDVYTILARLFEWAPKNLTFLISSRRVPELRLARLAAAGDVAYLTTDDLRFSRDETTQLFAVAYGHPLDPDLLGEVDARTEGWGASLQLVYSSIRTRPETETRAFIHSLSGAEGSLYDYLAEEVLSGLAPSLQRTLIHASLLDRVVPGLVVAILSVHGDPPSGDDVMVLLEEADDLGLMGRSAAGSTSRRFHPLLREFLVRQLETSSTPELRREMHLRVARVAEPTDWLTACHHFIEGGAPTEAMRVLNDSATAALGKGAWGPVGELLTRMEDLEPPPAVQVIRARGMIAQGNPEGALALLDGPAIVGVTPTEHALVYLARVAAAFHVADMALLRENLDQLLLQTEAPQLIREIAQAWSFMWDTAAGVGTFESVADLLSSLGERQSRGGHHFFAGVSFHNAAWYEVAPGNYEHAVIYGNRAISEFAKAPGPVPEMASTYSLLAVCAWELGDVQAALVATDAAIAIPGAAVDVFAESAYVAAIVGDYERAHDGLRRASRSVGPWDVGIRAQVENSRAILALAEGEPATAQHFLPDGLPQGGTDGDMRLRRMLLHCLLAAVADDADAQSIADRALVLARRQGAFRYEVRFEIARAAAMHDADALASLISAANSSGMLALVETADAIGAGLALWDPVPAALESSIAEWPSRWLPVLRRRLSTGNTPGAHMAARLLARHGTLADAPRLAAFERMYVRSARARTLGRSLVRRTSPKLRIRDLGRIRYQAGTREVALTDTRRKAASVLTYLISRPNQTATKEQVLDELWPDLDPEAAANSLNQTLYFLRRDIDPWYTDGISADYIVNESELMWLDRDLVQVDSADFHREASEALAAGQELTVGPVLVERYVGRFAPEFEYDEWAIGWRDRLHALFLHLVHATSRALHEGGRDSEALSLLLAAVNIDPEALELETELVRVYARVGAGGAAARQYRHYADAYRRELGAEPPSLPDLLRGIDSLQ